jgi:hypothetical protein
VRGEHDGGPGVAQAAHDLPGILARVRVEPGRRLVEEQQPRAADQAQGQVEAPTAESTPTSTCCALRAGAVGLLVKSTPPAGY